MSFWFNDPCVLAAGQSGTWNYWLNGGADMGPLMAQDVPFYAGAEGVLATGQGCWWDHRERKFYYTVTFTNFSNQSQSFQIRGGRLS